jgi:hypothetical protein
VLAVGDGIPRAALYAAAERAEARLGLAVNPVLRSSDQWKQIDGDPLVTEIKARPHLDVMETP